ncbi:B12-binding domain-containing radical SAM protein [bacterium]|nr:B12-binding domain-containing radical SAM protein [bacterium]
MRKSYKLLLIKPTQILDDGKLLKFEKALTPTRALPYIAGMTPPEFEVQIVDEFVQEVNFEEKVDLVGITALLPQIPRAIQIAKEFRKRGVKVVMGGVGPTSVAEKVIPYVDALVIGEAEGVWEALLEDFKADNLRKIYKNPSVVSLHNLPLPRFDLLNPKNYLFPGKEISETNLPRIPIETARGCPHNCEFCYSPRFFGRKVRFRPIDEVIKEVEKFRHSYIFFVDDNINANPKRSEELFKKLIPLEVKWVAQFSTESIKYPKLLELAKKAGCVNAFIGIESLNPTNLSSVGKSFNIKFPPQKIIETFRDIGIEVNISMIFGFDHDTPESLVETIEFLIQSKVHLLSLFILTPLPGTTLFEKFEASERLLHQNFSLYDASHVVFKPKNFTPESLEELYWSCFEKFYSYGNILKRFSNFWKWRKNLPQFWHMFKGNIFSKVMIENRINPLSGGSLSRHVF